MCHLRQNSSMLAAKYGLREVLRHPDSNRFDAPAHDIDSAGKIAVQLETVQHSAEKHHSTAVITVIGINF